MLNYGYTMVSADTAIAPIMCEPGWEFCGIDGNMVHVTDGDAEARIEIPFFDNAGCEVHEFRLDVGDTLETIHMLVPTQRGTRVCQVTIAVDKGQMFAVAKIRAPDAYR